MGKGYVVELIKLMYSLRSSVSAVVRYHNNSKKEKRNDVPVIQHSC